MAKFIKSIFSPNESSRCFEGPEEERRESPPLDGRRQLSISRSGRMRQNNKKRHSLALELYGDNGDINIDVVEKPKSMEYHVHTPVCSTASMDITTIDRPYITDTTVTRSTAHSADNQEHSSSFQNCLEAQSRKVVEGEKSPEEEIDNAFEIIDKT